MFKAIGFSTIFIISLSCGCSKQATDSAANKNDERQYTTPHFVIIFTALDRANITRIAQHLETNYERIAGDLNAGSLPVIAIHFYSDQQKFHRDLGMPNAPSWVIGIATSPTAIRMMSPNWPARNFDEMLTVAVHEFTHCVTLNIAPNIANNPRWLWEAAALYEAGQFVHPRNLSYMTGGNPPALAELDANWQTNTKIYDVGFVLIEYVVAKWGMPATVNLIKNLGHIPSALEISVQEFERGWYEFVKSKYL